MEKEIFNLMFDAACGVEIFDEDRAISASEASEKIRQICFDKLGLSKNSTDREFKRAMRSPAAIELFELIENVEDMLIAKGFHDDEFFDRFVDERNLAAGDDAQFYTNEDILLTVETVAGDHHDLITQKLKEGTTYTVPTSKRAIKMGGALKRFMTGRDDWAKLIAAIAKTYANEVKTGAYRAFINMGTGLPTGTQWKKTGTLSNTVKESFDQLIVDVSAANDGADVMIVGTRMALKKLNNLADVDWISEYEKENVAKSGILGTYEGSTLVELPQRLDQDGATHLVDQSILMIMPVVDYKPIKFVDKGETTLEVTEPGATLNDEQTIEVQREFGVGTLITRYFGVWDMDA